MLGPFAAGCTSLTHSACPLRRRLVRQTLALAQRSIRHCHGLRLDLLQRFLQDHIPTLVVAQLPQHARRQRSCQSNRQSPSGHKLAHPALSLVSSGKAWEASPRCRLPFVAGGPHLRLLGLFPRLKSLLRRELIPRQGHSNPEGRLRAWKVAVVWDGTHWLVRVA